MPETGIRLLMAKLGAGDGAVAGVSRESFTRLCDTLIAVRRQQQQEGKHHRARTCTALWCPKTFATPWFISLAAVVRHQKFEYAMQCVVLTNLLSILTQIQFDPDQDQVRLKMIRNLETMHD